jgi:hypothetical protein
MEIDPHSGVVTLPSGYPVGPDLSQAAFRADAVGAEARSQDYGTLPWIHYHFSGGQLEGKPLLASVCFYDQLLVSLTLTVDLYPPGPRDWSSYSLEVEAATKEFHDGLLTRTLGKPTQAEPLPLRPQASTPATLTRPLIWSYPWGRVISGHDFKGGGTSITVQYGNRLEEASEAYRTQGASGA